MHRYLVSGVLCAAVFFISAAHGGGPDLRIATEDHYPPFSHRDEQGTLTGFNVELGHALCQAMNRTCEIVHRPWNDLIPGLTEHEYDLVIACMSATPERDRLVDFTDHYLRSKTGFIGRKDTPGDLSPQGLAGAILASQEGTAPEGFLRHKYGTTSTIRTFPTMSQAYQALARGEVDLVLSPILAAYEYMKSPEGADLEFVGEALLPDEYPHTPAHIAVREGDVKLRDQINDALRDVKINGSYDRITRKYFPFSVY